jgi:hypothetical protein
MHSSCAFQNCVEVTTMDTDTKASGYKPTVSIVMPFVVSAAFALRNCRGRDDGYPPPPAQNRTCSFTASGSHLG